MADPITPEPTVVPPAWWSPAERMMFVQHSDAIYDDEGNAVDELPADAVRLVPDTGQGPDVILTGAEAAKLPDGSAVVIYGSPTHGRIERPHSAQIIDGGGLAGNRDMPDYLRPDWTYRVLWVKGREQDAKQALLGTDTTTEAR